MNARFPLLSSLPPALCLALAAFVLLALPVDPAEAASDAPCVASGTMTLSPADITILPNTPNGPVGSPTTATITFNCATALAGTDRGTTTLQAAVMPAIDPRNFPPNGGIMIPVAPGLDVNLTVQSPATQVSAGPLGPGGVPGWEMATLCQDGRPLYNHGICVGAPPVFAATFQAQLVKVGNVTAGTTNTLKLLQFTNYGYGQTDSAPYYATLSINKFAVAVPACTVAVDPTVVTLPPVSTPAFTGKGSTAKTTPFNVQLTCSAGSKVAITLATSNALTGATGVIAPTVGSGYARNVGVQILDKNNKAISFGQVVSAATQTTTSGSNNLVFFARYYQTATGVTAGNVAATATYTLTYP